ncbi:MYXO-CTERM domain-containing protein [Janthinobacterium sp. CG_23.3]|uniref:PEP-CTERM sorting domain-containing protein n=1 Tax=unclassified Janthinobacterium TaxID=2610881 RepID=UPI00034C8BDB|nr:MULTISPECIES: PEP-CTERM sorting domain-containing protein [unclassified Janthinobacterium]MEC5161083.1 MYXO-CTERM domain-containing protein [Janthinobacterium sp. CG_S6]
MKTAMTAILRAGVAAAVLTLASAGASAAGSNLTATLHGAGMFTASGGAFGPGNSVTPGVWEATYDSNTFLAFCLQPTVALNASNNHYGSAAFAASDSIKRLYEGYYTSSVANLATSYAAAQAFQLALWELNNDNGNLLGGALKFKNLNNAIVLNANTMLGTALGSGAIHNTFNYTSLSSAGVGSVSQNLLSVSAVPEAQTWAMLVAGLGLLGFMRRRQA